MKILNNAVLTCQTPKAPRYARELSLQNTEVPGVRFSIFAENFRARTRRSFGALQVKEKHL